MGNKPSSFGTTSVYKSENENEVKPKDLKIRDGYYRNKQNVYYDGVSLKLLKNELKTFKKLKYGYAKTKKNVFYKGQIIPQAYVETFIVINRKNMPQEYQNLNSVIGMDFENKNGHVLKRIYQFGKIIYTIKV